MVFLNQCGRHWVSEAGRHIENDSRHKEQRYIVGLLFGFHFSVFLSVRALRRAVDKRRRTSREAGRISFGKRIVFGFGIEYGAKSGKHKGGGGEHKGNLGAGSIEEAGAQRAYDAAQGASGIEEAHHQVAVVGFGRPLGHQILEQRDGNGVEGIEHNADCHKGPDGIGKDHPGTRKQQSAHDNDGRPAHIGLFDHPHTNGGVGGQSH